MGSASGTRYPEKGEKYADTSTESTAYEDLLKRDGKLITHSVGNSMLPLLQDRKSIVVLEDISQVPPKRGDVVLYKMNGTYILHRILHIEEDKYLIRGDNTWAIEHVPKASVAATMTGFYRYPDSALMTCENAAYKFYCLMLPVIRWSRRFKGKVKRKIVTLYFGK